MPYLVLKDGVSVNEQLGVTNVRGEDIPILRPHAYNEGDVIDDDMVAPHVQKEVEEGGERIESLLRYVDEDEAEELRLKANPEVEAEPDDDAAPSTLDEAVSLRNEAFDARDEALAEVERLNGEVERLSSENEQLQSQLEEATAPAAEGEDGDTPPAEEPQEQTEGQFDPRQHTAEQVLEYLQDKPADEVKRVQDLETQGEKRVTVLRFEAKAETPGGDGQS